MDVNCKFLVFFVLFGDHFSPHVTPLHQYMISAGPQSVDVSATVYPYTILALSIFLGCGSKPALQPPPAGRGEGGCVEKRNTSFFPWFTIVTNSNLSCPLCSPFFRPPPLPSDRGMCSSSQQQVEYGLSHVLTKRAAGVCWDLFICLLTPDILGIPTITYSPFMPALQATCWEVFGHDERSTPLLELVAHLWVHVTSCVESFMDLCRQFSFFDLPHRTTRYVAWVFAMLRCAGTNCF